MQIHACAGTFKLSTCTVSSGRPSLDAQQRAPMPVVISQTGSLFTRSWPCLRARGADLQRRNCRFHFDSSHTSGSPTLNLLTVCAPQSWYRCISNSGQTNSLFPLLAPSNTLPDCTLGMLSSVHLQLPPLDTYNLEFTSPEPWASLEVPKYL